VLDSTDPAQVRSFEKKVDLARTLFVVSSKSGGTLEPNIFKQYFFERVKQVVGEKQAGNRFIAITDPGSKMQHVAESDRFRHIFFGLPSIGGRYSVLSDFGLVPAAIMGLDVATLLDRAEEIVHACTPSVPAEENPGASTGRRRGRRPKTKRFFGFSRCHFSGNSMKILLSGCRKSCSWSMPFAAR
jgi:transaldolase/glucose-6-phosphate isomerase